MDPYTCKSNNSEKYLVNLEHPGTNGKKTVWTPVVCRGGQELLDLANATLAKAGFGSNYFDTIPQIQTADAMINFMIGISQRVSYNGGWIGVSDCWNNKIWGNMRAHK